MTTVRAVVRVGGWAGGLVLAPVGVGVEDHHLLVAQDVEARAGAPHVLVPVAAADLHLEAPEALLEQLLCAPPHRLRPVHADHVVDGEPRMERAPEQVAGDLNSRSAGRGTH